MIQLCIKCKNKPVSVHCEQIQACSFIVLGPILLIFKGSKLVVKWGNWDSKRSESQSFQRPKSPVAVADEQDFDHVRILLGLNYKLLCMISSFEISISITSESSSKLSPISF